MNGTTSGKLLNDTTSGTLLNDTTSGTLLNDAASGIPLNDAASGIPLNDTASGKLSNDTTIEILLDDTCLLNLGYSIFHIGFAILLLLVLCIAYCQSKNQRQNLVKLPGHSIRWVFSLALLLIQVVALAEGILTDRAQSDGPSLLYLYVPAICAFVATAVAMLTAHNVEIWQRMWMSYVLLIYWILSFGFETVRLGNLVRVNVARFFIVRYDIELLLLCICGILSVIHAFANGIGVSKPQ